MKFVSRGFINVLRERRKRRLISQQIEEAGLTWFCEQLFGAKRSPDGKFIAPKLLDSADAYCERYNKGIADLDVHEWNGIVFETTVSILNERNNNVHAVVRTGNPRKSTYSRSNTKHFLEGAKASVGHSTPRIAEKLLLLIVPREHLEYVAGDCTEKYLQLSKSQGSHFAKIWYWKQIVSFLWPGLKRLLYLASAWKAIDSGLKRLFQ